MFFDWLKLAHKSIDDMAFAIPNGGSRHPAEAMNLKRQGVKKGVFDVYISIPRNEYNGLYIEFKSRNGKLTKEQEVFQRNARSHNYIAEVCYNFDEAKKLTECYFKIVNNRSV